MQNETTTTDRAAKGAPITDTTTTREGATMTTDTTAETITINITADALAVLIDAVRSHSAQCHRDAVKMSEAAAKTGARVREAHAEEPHESIDALLALNGVPDMWARVRTAAGMGAAADRIGDALTDALRGSGYMGAIPGGGIPAPGIAAARTLEDADPVRVIDID